MKITVLREREEGEGRVAASPDVVRKYAKLGVKVAVESGAGLGSAVPDEDFEAAGAETGKALSDLCAGADVFCKVRSPSEEELAAIPEGSILIGMLAPYDRGPEWNAYRARKLTTFSLELLPRISRAQSMDVLSSQSNLAGYRAVIEAVAAFGKAVPMMMTAAGTVPPAKALVLGAGVAGLQAIATAKRLGAVVSAFDVRPVVKEQVESLGAKFIMVPVEETGEAQGGYAKEMSEEYKRRQQKLIHETIVKQDMVITTALIPGKPAPTLITEEMVADMRPGSVIVDLAAAAGGNCPLTRPDKIIDAKGVTILGYTNLPSHVAVDASPLYARNLYNFVSTLLVGKDGNLAVQWDDELIKGTLCTRDGEAVHPAVK